MEHFHSRGSSLELDQCVGKRITRGGRRKHCGVCINPGLVGDDHLVSSCVIFDGTVLLSVDWSCVSALWVINRVRFVESATLSGSLSDYFSCLRTDRSSSCRRYIFGLVRPPFSGTEKEISLNLAQTSTRTEGWTDLDFSGHRSASLWAHWTSFWPQLKNLKP